MAIMTLINPRKHPMVDILDRDALNDCGAWVKTVMRMVRQWRMPLIAGMSGTDVNNNHTYLIHSFEFTHSSKAFLRTI